jgi:hypothetical protein
LRIYILSIIGLLWLLVSCNHGGETYSALNEVKAFRLAKDYSDFKNKMNESDTIYVSMNLSSCQFYAIEKFAITKYKDSLIIEPEMMMDGVSNPKFVKEDKIKISISDTIWKFEEFLKENKYRLDSIEGESYPLSLYCNSEKLKYFTSGLSDLNKLIIDYCNTMLRLNPNNMYYPYTEMPEELEVKDVHPDSMILEN